jgi:hypothetical protein
LLTELFTSRWGINNRDHTLDEMQQWLQALPGGPSEAAKTALNCLGKLYAIRYRPYPATEQELLEISRLLTLVFQADPHEQTI